MAASLADDPAELQRIAGMTGTERSAMALGSYAATMRQRQRSCPCGCATTRHPCAGSSAASDRTRQPRVQRIHRTARATGRCLPQARSGTGKGQAVMP